MGSKVKSLNKLSLSFGIILLVAILKIIEIEGANILLFFPGGTYSHTLTIWPYANALAEKGHNVTFFSAHKAPTENPKITFVQPQVIQDVMKAAYLADRFDDRMTGKDIELWNTYHEVMVSSCQALTDPKNREDRELDKLLSSQFDLVVVNSIYGDCGFVFAHYYKAKYIISHSASLSMWHSDAFGYMQETSWIPDISYRFTYPLDLWQRTVNAFVQLPWLYERYHDFYPKMEQIMKKFLKLDYDPSFEDMERNASLVLINAHHSAEFARSFPPQIISVGGMALWVPEKPIPDKFNQFLNSSGNEGVVLISFGSSIELSTSPKYFQQMFLNLVKRFDKINFIMKWKGTLPKEFHPAPKNLLCSEWLPQREILRHKKINAFITHGGLNSIHEATYYGVPLLVVPLFADQDFNAYRIQAQEIGIPLEIRNISPEILESSLQTVLSDPKYRNNMAVRSKLFRDRPQNPIETAIYWTEFVLRHDDTTSMKPMSTHLTWYQKRLLDVYALVTFFTLGLLLVFYFLFKSVLSVLTRNVFLTSGQKKHKVN